MDIAKQRNFLLKEIKINKPGGPTTGKYGFINFLKEYGKFINELKPKLIQKYNNNEGLGQDLIEFIINNYKILDNKYNIGSDLNTFREWLNEYVDDIGLPIGSSGSLYTALLDDDWIYNTHNNFGLNEEELYELLDEFKNW